MPPAEFARLSARLDECCEREGRDPATIRRAINLQFMLATDAAAAATVREAVETQWGGLAPRVIEGGLAGTPDQAVERIAEYVAAGADAVNIALRAPWQPEALDAWFEVVVPQARAAT